MSSLNHSKKLAATLVIGGLFMFVIAGCNRDNPVESTALAPTANEDVAEAVASDIGYTDGGAVDQVSDLLSLASGSGVVSAAKFVGTEAAASATPVYDPGTGQWTLTFTRERGLAAGPYYAYMQRTYTYQFLNQNGIAQQFYITGNDTAYSIRFNIVQGEGRHMTRRLSQALTGLSGSWTATGTNHDTITINGSYQRSAVDTIRTRFALRTMEHASNWQFIDITGPRGVQSDLCAAVGGSIEGTYTANITFQSGKAYGERNVSRTITATLQNGSANISVNGNQFNADLCTGELVTNQVM